MKTGDVLLDWDRNPPENKVAEYRVYERLASGYSLRSKVTVPPARLVHVPRGTHIYAVTAVNAAGIESAPSREVTKRI